MLGNNRPNPFSHTTLIDYELAASGCDARLRVTSLLGQTITTIALPVQKGTIQLDAGLWQSGIYHYSLVVDGKVVETRLMMVD